MTGAATLLVMCQTCAMQKTVTVGNQSEGSPYYLVK